MRITAICFAFLALFLGAFTTSVDAQNAATFFVSGVDQDPNNPDVLESGVDEIYSEGTYISGQQGVGWYTVISVVCEVNHRWWDGYAWQTDTYNVNVDMYPGSPNTYTTDAVIPVAKGIELPDIVTMTILFIKTEWYYIGTEPEGWWVEGNEWVTEKSITWTLSN